MKTYTRILGIPFTPVIPMIDVPLSPGTPFRPSNPRTPIGPKSPSLPINQLHHKIYTLPIVKLNMKNIIFISKSFKRINSIV